MIRNATAVGLFCLQLWGRVCTIPPITERVCVDAHADASNGAFIAVVCARPACSYTPALDTQCHVLVLWRGRM